MSIKEIWSKTRNWYSNRDTGRQIDNTINEQGLIADCQVQTEESTPAQQNQSAVIVQKAKTAGRKENIEVLNDAFNKLVGQLEGINTNLNKQVTQHSELMSRIEQLPELLQTLPNVVDGQRKVVDQLVDQLKTRALKDQQFIEAVEKIPSETTRQTNTMIDMSHKLSAAADANVQVSENFNRFNDTLDKLDTDVASQTDGILQMSKTFSASDRYLKYILSKQNKRFMWIFVISLAVCVFAIISLIICLALVLNR